MVSELLAGQQLNPNDKLTSPNGIFELIMQTDGNLVLYQSGAVAGPLDALDVQRVGTPITGPIGRLMPIGTRHTSLVAGAPTAYWSTDTWALPAEQRPTRAVMQEDGHLVLYDAGDVPRWGSGTWGPAFTNPFLRLHDDGNLVILHSGDRAIWASGAPGGGGAIPPRGFTDAEPTLSSALDQLGRLPPVVSGSVTLGQSQTGVAAGGVSYTVVEQRRRTTQEVVEQAYLQDLAKLGVWPGQVIQGRPLLAGDVAAIGPLPRQPGVINVVTDLIGNTVGAGQSAHVAAPSSDTVDAARRDILSRAGPTDSPGMLKASVEKADTVREVGLKLGLNVKGSNFGVDANASLTQSYKITTAVAVVRQVFYSVTFTPSGPQAEGFWTDDVDYPDIAPYVSVGNPPLFIDSAQYGRLICVMAQGAFSSSELTAALKANLQGATTVGVDVSGRTKEVMNSSTVQVYTIGVPGQLGFQKLSDPIGELEQVYQSGLRFSLANPGAPISFTARHIADNTLARVAVAAEYVQPISAVGQDVTNAAFEIWDGPGGGLKDTGINVNPGDNVTVSTGGSIKSGVVFSGPHGPEGWPGHAPDPAAPIPERNHANAYSLVVSFGGARGTWIEAGPYWEGTVDTAGGVGRRIVLNINDNNPYNGDPAYKWLSTVNVRRGDAAAAGVYI